MAALKRALDYCSRLGHYLCRPLNLLITTPEHGSSLNCRDITLDIAVCFRNQMGVFG
jgi:hypothetical protein